MAIIHMQATRTGRNLVRKESMAIMTPRRVSPLLQSASTATQASIASKRDSLHQVVYCAPLVTSARRDLRTSTQDLTRRPPTTVHAQLDTTAQRELLTQYLATLEPTIRRKVPQMLASASHAHQATSALVLQETLPQASRRQARSATLATSAWVVTLLKSPVSPLACTARWRHTGLSGAHTACTRMLATVATARCAQQVTSA